MHTHRRSSDPVATIGLDIGKNTFHLVGLDKRGAIVMRIKVSRNQLLRRLVNLPACLLGLEAGFWLASHSPPDPATRARRSADPRPVRQAFPEGTQERLPRC